MEQEHNIIIVGDLFPTEQNVSFFSKGDVDSLFGKEITQLFSGADFCVCNLEGALTDHLDKCRKTGPIKVATTSAVEAYKKLGIDLCLLANNHATDGGHQGMIDTMCTLDKAGIKHIGAGKNQNEIVRFAIQKVGGLNIGFYNVSETMYNKPTKDTAGAWLYDEYVVCRELEQLKKQCDYLVVLYHGGIEKFHYPSPETRKRFHRMADCGADFITAQHTHCIGCEEWYNGSYLLYGQGNFLFSKQHNKPMMTEGLIMEIQLNNNGVQIDKHRIELTQQAFITYSKNQSLNAFYERSKNVNNEDLIIEKYKNLESDNYIEKYLLAFKGRRYIWIKLKKLLPKKIWLKLIESYSNTQLMLILYTMTSDRTFEDIYYVWQRLKEINKKN